MDPDYLRSLPEDKLRVVAEKLLLDLKEARESRNQTPQNSSRPPSSRDPWHAAEPEEAEDPSPDEPELPPAQSDKPVDQATAGEPKREGEEQKTQAIAPRKPGKQPGSPGVGRLQKLVPTHRLSHEPDACRACGALFEAETPAAVYTARQELNLERPAQGVGIQVAVIEHVYGEKTCRCGHGRRVEPHRCAPDPLWSVALTEWHLVGPELLALILCLTFRLRASRARVQEFLWDWLGLHLSHGTLHQCVHEAGRAVEPVEDQLVEELQQAQGVHGDESPWRQGAALLWLWVFISARVTLYFIAYRTAEVLENVLETGFSGWLMSDGYQVYRAYRKRLRCWAHLQRKARGLVESLDRKAQSFGKEVLEVLDGLMKAVYEARESPGRDLVMDSRARLEEFRAACERQREAQHEKTRALAREFLNDWEAIFEVLAHPELPLTNNEAERALRHWVIARKLSLGTRTTEGSRAYALLASVIETCRKRNISPWDYLAHVIRARRAGQDVPRFPAVAAT
jgi:hypothetical protein